MRHTAQNGWVLLENWFHVQRAWGRTRCRQPEWRRRTAESQIDRYNPVGGTRHEVVAARGDSVPTPHLASHVEHHRQPDITTATVT